MRLSVWRAILCGLKRGARIGIGLPGGPHRTTCPKEDPEEHTPTTEDVRLVFGSDAKGMLLDDRVAAFDHWLAGHDAEVREQALAPIRAALAGHPTCDIHPDDDPVSCGWKRAVADVRQALGEGDAS